jgi:predicted O-methyltransferase YrrM
VTSLLHRRWLRLKDHALVAIIREAQRLVERYPLPARPSRLPADVRAALALQPAQIQPLREDEQLRAVLARGLARAEFRASRDIFSLEGHMLPCWLDSDLGLVDDWLTTARYYPLYFALFQSCSAQGRALRMLEIGVRTGYMAAAFARATCGPAFYLGLDPNQYVREGLRLAHETLAILHRHLPSFDYALIEGYSWDRAVQQSLAYSGPFDLVHVDGDHTLEGKLLDLELVRGLLAPAALVLVDDYDNHAIVPEAVRRALALGWYRSFAYLPTLRGLAVLQR